MKTFRPCLAEFLGTFYMCFAGIGAILCGTPAVGAAPGLLGIALAHGLALSIAVNAFGAVNERGRAVKIGGFGIGLTVAFDILCGGPVTGASMNPCERIS
ncbi:MAG TPA: aquaporin [Vicinamibacterales bacterium]|nr:aquaporin [Vicinamibacterales bacterium]